MRTIPAARRQATAAGAALQSGFTLGTSLPVFFDFLPAERTGQTDQPEFTGRTDFPASFGRFTAIGAFPGVVTE